MFKKGDKVKISQESKYLGRENQLPVGVVGVVRDDYDPDEVWVPVRWNGGRNSYFPRDLIKVSLFKGNK